MARFGVYVLSSVAGLGLSCGGSSKHQDGPVSAAAGTASGGVGGAQGGAVGGRGPNEMTAGDSSGAIGGESNGNTGGASNSGAASGQGGMGIAGTTGVSSGSGGAAAGLAGMGGGSAAGAAATGGSGELGGESGAPPSAGGAGGDEPGGTGGGGGATSPPVCQPDCGTHKWACWPMPNPLGTGFPNEGQYEETESSIVRDLITCLEWHKIPPVETYQWQEALDYCDSLSLSGKDDWRVPTRIELASILDFTETDGAGPPFWYTHSWTSSTIAREGQELPWSFQSAGEDSSLGADSPVLARTVRCVRGGGDGEAPFEPAVPPPNQYTVLGSAQVRDNYTGLIWERGGSETEMSWEDSFYYCADLELEGGSWRVPTIHELATLVDEARSFPAINVDMFPDTKAGVESVSQKFYWASHSVAYRTAAWAIEFGMGYMLGRALSTDSGGYTTGFVKCVR